MYILILPALMGMMAFPVFARPSLSDDARINHELTAAAVADEIRDQCSNISARMTTALTKALALRDYAMKLGYSGAEIQAFLNNKQEQRRIYGLRDAYLKQNGVSKGDASSYCRLGEAEINQGSLIGSILKSN